MKLRALLPFGIVALAVAAYAAQGIVLKRSPKVGTKTTYKVTGKFEVMGAEVELKGKTVEEIVKVDGDAYSTKSTTQTTVSVMGQEMPQPESTESSTQKLNGMIVEVKQGETSVDPGAMRLAHLNTIYFDGKAVEKDGTWVLDAKKDEKLGTPAYKITYKYLGEEKVGKFDTYKISAEGTETEGDQPTKIKSTIWVSKEDGTTVRTSSELVDAVFRGDVPPLSGKMEIAREE